MAGTPGADSGMVRAAAAAGIAGPAVFVAVVIGQGLAHADYSHLAHPVSALAAFPAGWVQSANFIVFAGFLAVFAIGLHRAVAPGPLGAAGPALLLVGAAGLVLAGLVPYRMGADGFIVPGAHVAGAVMVFAGVGAGFLALSRRLSADPAWRGLAPLALWSGIAILAVFAVIAGFARLPGLPLHPWLGLLQRLAVAAWFLTMIVLAMRLWRLAARR